MSRGFVDLPEITSENFEQSLSSDQIFIEFFNDFLQLPVFVVPLRYDGISAGFELLDHSAELLSRRIRTALHQIRSRTVSDPSWTPAEPVRDNSYSVTRLDREQSVRWMKSDRLPFFLQSDCYFEFRLTKRLHQLSTGSSSSQTLCCDQCRLLSAQTEKNSSFISPNESCSSTHGGAGGCLQRCGARRSFLDFRRSLVSGPGENVLHLWMDIERLKTLSTKTKSRYLGWMKGQYVVSSSSAALSEQMLSRLELNSTTCWTEERLRDTQPRLTETLLLYWCGQRFCLFSSGQWPVCDHVWSSSVHSELSVFFQPVCVSASVCRDTEVELDSSEIQTLLEVLHTESRSGFFFTNFCQKSGQQLWENAVYFCSELLQYHQLFCQSRFDPYRVQRTAQLLYASYLSSGAPMSVDLSEEHRRTVLLRLSPPFEDLFDRTEEHALRVLLEPWTLITERVRDTLHTVTQWQEVCFAEAELFQTLQTLYTHTHTQSRIQQELRTSPAEGSRAPNLWSKVPPEFRGFRLDSLLRNRRELQHFQSFLEQNSARQELQCWLDVEQLKKSDGALLKERNTSIRDKYLSSSFLFGPRSPATEEQQMRLLQMCGGWQGLQRESVSLNVLTELQSLLHNRLETRWLPLFLSSSLFITRQQQKVTEVECEPPVVHQHRRRYVWKQVSGGLMSWSQESVALRRALLNPVTCLLFQKFLSVRDDLLENDLLFWLEVQRYKDLCHSRCDDVTLQRKVSIIISCFLSSSLPPGLQVHVPPDAVQRVLSQQRALGPYVFRETQACVFDELLKHWPDFMELLSSVGANELQSVLERETRRSRATEEDHSAQEQEDEAHAVADEEQLNCWTDGTRAATYKNRRTSQMITAQVFFMVTLLSIIWIISWSYAKHMADMEHEKTQNSTAVTSPSSSSSTGQREHTHKKAADAQTQDRRASDQRKNKKELKS
ncbi:regulator of G-protein signaling 22 [Puntigrus tetrazona]|uniref:regulator of G-protein signaling 22 n=1 Tax=Puntigrus tetrazona TaxID=1606681 RepID=UPI001C8A4E0B|nr:regulator of G-protein signaling 22 [Puntigrus tetrazona]